MAAWLITIGERYPQHMQYAMEKGFWDLASSRRPKIAAGDLIYFKYGGGSVGGMFRTTSGVEPIRDSNGEVVLHDKEPTWDTPPNIGYSYRVHLEPVSVTPKRLVAASDVRMVLGAKDDASYMFRGPFRFPAKSAEALQEFFFAPGVDLALPGSRPVLGEGALHEPPARRLARVASRVGQGEFRERLLEAYGGKCALTGASVPEALEAAHIIDHNECGINDTWNGILLRADVHRLFDRSLIRIRSRRRVEVDQCLAGTEYGDLRKLAFPINVDDHPAPHALRWRWTEKNGRHLSEF